MSRSDFIDHYAILQVGPNCDAKTLEGAYRRLAKMYHPDHVESADVTKFNEVIVAYKMLRNPRRRADYDGQYREHFGDRWNGAADAIPEIFDDAALNDADDHAKILMHLYKKRREDAQNAGVIGFYLQEMLNCSHEHFEFHKWYLKEKGYIALDEQGSLAITIQGVDHVISMSRTSRAEKLLIGQMRETD